MYWFEKYNLDIHRERISGITRKDLVQLLQFSDGGLESIIKRSGKNKREVRKALKRIEDFSFSEAIDFILLHPYVLRTPVIIDRHNNLIGYNENEIRKFLPKEYRRQQIYR